MEHQTAPHFSVQKPSHPRRPGTCRTSCPAWGDRHDGSLDDARDVQFCSRGFLDHTPSPY
eukprot:3008029-Rhodomonas_salina.1